MPDLAGFGPQLLAGAAVTLELAFGALALGLVLGLLGAAAKLSASAWIRALAFPPTASSSIRSAKR